MTRPLALAALALVACGHAGDAPPVAPAPSPAAAPPAALAPSPSPPPAPATPASATEVLAAHRAPFDACYARARAARSELGMTRVDIDFTVGDAGKPETVSLAYTHRWDDAAKDCMRAAALDLTFPPALHGRQSGTIRFEPR